MKKLSSFFKRDGSSRHYNFRDGYRTVDNNIQNVRYIAPDSIIGEIIATPLAKKGDTFEIDGKGGRVETWKIKETYKTNRLDRVSVHCDLVSFFDKE